jgi:hypothetical protein
MNRPSVELADILGDAGPEFLTPNRRGCWWPFSAAGQSCSAGRWTPARDVDLRPSAITRAATGMARGVRPRCRDRWIEDRRRDLRPTRYAQVVFTIHHALVPLASPNKAEVYGLRLRARADT